MTSRKLSNRRSTSGITIKLGDSTVLWKSKIQKTVAHSTMEAEFKVLASAVSLSIWIKEMINELGFNYSSIKFYCDNQGCIAALRGDNYKGRCKHNQIHFHIIQERINFNQIVLQYIPSESNVADLFTKVLSRFKLQHLKEKLGIGV